MELGWKKSGKREEAAGKSSLKFHLGRQKIA